MPNDVVTFAFVVEGHGEVDAVPLLVRRICGEMLGCWAVKTTRPVRIPKSKLVRPHELERAILLARNINRGQGPVLVVLDADDDCPASLGPQLRSRALSISQPHEVSIVIPKYEFETWFLTAARSMSGLGGLRQELLARENPEGIRGAKEWLSRNMVPGKTYSPTIDQAVLVSSMDLPGATLGSQSFARLCREIERLLVSHRKQGGP